MKEGNDTLSNTSATWRVDGMMDFVLFGLARQEEMPQWVNMDWSKPILHLGPGNKIIHNAIDIAYPEFDFNRDDFFLPFDDDSIGGVVATHVLEHLESPMDMIREVATVLAPGCPFNILVPHANSMMYLHDLDHKKPFVLDTWRNVLQNQYYDTMYGEDPIPLDIGVNFKFALKEGNEAIITQLIKKAN